MAAQKQWIALLRAVLPATHKKMSMQDLRSACDEAGFTHVSTHAASGNLLFTSSAAKLQLQQTLENIIASFGLGNAVILRTPAQLKAIVDHAPFADAASKRPNHLLIFFYDRKLKATAVSELVNREGPERVEALNRELCVDYTEGVARSKLTPALIERHLGQPGTARNWNAINKLIARSDRQVAD